MSPIQCRAVPAINHHLWRNRRTWWAAFTVVHDGHRQQRVRRSLGTHDVVEARARRDRLMEEYAGRSGVVLSLRTRSPRRAEGPNPWAGPPELLIAGLAPPACLPWDWD
jgi:hypothetical protein